MRMGFVFLPVCARSGFAINAAVAAPRCFAVSRSWYAPLFPLHFGGVFGSDAKVFGGGATSQNFGFFPVEGLR